MTDMQRTYYYTGVGVGMAVISIFWMLLSITLFCFKFDNPPIAAIALANGTIGLLLFMLSWAVRRYSRAERMKLAQSGLMSGTLGENDL